ncbi:MAG: UDP-N-acetylglucosamine 2-epimerase (non-hydrolyzing) [Chloroflexales bacterium]
MKVVCVVGARPNFMKIAPIVAELRGFQDIETILVHTGQHYDNAMSEIFFQELDIQKPDFNLGVGSGTHTEQTAQVMLALEPLFVNLCPDLILVVGDVNSTLAAALVATKLRIPLAHIEAGLRSYDREMPEEVNRVLTDAMADYLFTTEPEAAQNLRREGINDDRIFFVGNVMIDTLVRHRKQAESLNMPARFNLTTDNYALVTLHRPSNVDSPTMLHGLLAAINTIQLRIPVLFPVHPRTRRRIAEAGLQQTVDAMANLRLVDPLGYLDFLGIMAGARLVLTDSGGIQEETTILGVPCLTLRENTERPVTVTAGTNQIVGTNPERIVAAAMQAIETRIHEFRQPELWDGHAAERIVAIIRTLNPKRVRTHI